MRTQITLVAFLVGFLTGTGARADETSSVASSASRPYSVGTSLFTLLNMVPDDHPAHFYQLNVGYELTPNDRVSVEAVTWRYYHPLGIPWGKPRYSAADEYPGHVREYGVGLAYQRTLWKGIYASLSAVPFWRQYYDAQGKEVENGFQLFLTARLGYHLRLMDRVFIEPSIAFTYWPFSTRGPDGFAAQNRKWPSYFLFEPGLHAGVVF
jgi:hypothetical protein